MGKNEEGATPVIYKNLKVLIINQLSFMAVCGTCYIVYSGEQQLERAKGGGNWRKKSKDYLRQHQTEKGWCECCDPVHGKGGLI